MAVGVQLLWLLTGLSSLLAEIVVIGALTSLGYRFTPTGRFTGAGLIPAALFTLLQISALVLGVRGCWLLVRRKEKSLAVFGARFFRRPFFIGLAVVAGGVLLVRLGAVFDSILLMNWFPQDQIGAVAISRTLASAFIYLTTALALAALTVVLARRRLRLRTKSAA